MTVQLTDKLQRAYDQACAQLPRNLGSATRELAEQYLTYIFSGQGRPTGALTDKFGRMIAEAAQLGLQQAYGTGSKLAAVNSDVMTRINVLRPAKEKVAQ